MSEDRISSVQDVVSALMTVAESYISNADAEFDGMKSDTEGLLDYVEDSAQNGRSYCHGFLKFSFLYRFSLRLFFECFDDFFDY